LKSTGTPSRHGAPIRQSSGTFSAGRVFRSAPRSRAALLGRLFNLNPTQQALPIVFKIADDAGLPRWF
jgi:hypothetical protein